MSKITFRADDELVDRLEALDGSKSEIMREALRSYLDEHQERPRRGTARQQGSRQPDARGGQTAQRGVDEASLDELIAGRVDALLDQRLRGQRPSEVDSGRDVNVNVTVEQGETGVNTEKPRAEERQTGRRHRTSADLSASQSRLCPQCGETVTSSHVFCPNCGEKASNRAFCECGDEIRPDWAHCPRCGRRTPSADVLDRS